MTTLVLLAAANLLLNPSYEDWPDGFWLMPSWQDANGRRIPNANRGSGVNHMSVKMPWGQVAVKNYLAPTNATYLVMNMGPNDSWSHNGVPGMIWVDNASVTESASVVEDAPVVVKPTDALTVYVVGGNFMFHGQEILFV